MSIPNDGTTPPGPPTPPASGGGAPPPPPPASYPGSGQDVPVQKTKLPMWSLILSLLSFLCLPIILAVAGIIAGFIGRGKAKEEGSGTGMATAGIVLGFINIVLVGIVVSFMAVAGVAIFNTVSQQVKIASELQPASVAAEAYKQANGSYEGLSTAALADFGFRSADDVTVTAKSSPDGATYCIEGATTADPGNVIHVPAGSSSVTIKIDGKQYAYAPGACAATYQ